jgi:hypothetical protein
VKLGERLRIIQILKGGELSWNSLPQLCWGQFGCRSQSELVFFAKNNTVPTTEF